MSRQQLLTLIATILGSTVVFLDATVVNVALPSISNNLNSPVADGTLRVSRGSFTLPGFRLRNVEGSIRIAYDADKPEPPLLAQVREQLPVLPVRPLADDVDVPAAS